MVGSSNADVCLVGPHRRMAPTEHCDGVPTYGMVWHGRGADGVKRRASLEMSQSTSRTNTFAMIKKEAAKLVKELR